MLIEKLAAKFLKRKENKMFNKLFASLGNISLFHTAISYLESLIADVIGNLEAGDSAKDAAIDAIIEILQAHKSTNQIVKK
jgi:hypothetical protein